ncbi:MAG: HAMP domain-containing histidine kinase [Deltaproteobacteria bacterium]|nr:HAMP domain-containing histidine kinase [Deltaproteobacteria bacterium]
MTDSLPTPSEPAAVNVAERFDQHVAERNRRSARAAVWLTAGLNLGFVALDRLLTDDPGKLAVLLADRAAIAVAVVGLAWAARRPWFARHTAVVTGIYMASIDVALAVMTTQLGGFSSGYYAGINLVTLAAGLLFLWPTRVAAMTHAAAVAAYTLANVPGWEAGQLREAVMHGFFLTSTAVIATVGQAFSWKQARQQLETQAAVEQTKERLEAAHGELQRLDQFKSAFFANITHELKTPLAMVLSPLELLYQGDLGPLGETQKATIRSMLRSGFKLLALIDDLLDLARAEQAGIRLRIAERDVKEHLGALVQQIGVLARRKDVELTAVWPDEPCMVWCDIDRLERVWINLLSNALKFTPPGGHVWVELRRHGDGVQVQVRDDGPGFPPELAGKLFDRFYQVDMGGTRRHGGAGIGLALARHIVELHGGTIGARGDIDKGAEFTVYLPADRAHFGDRAVEEAPHSETERAPSQGDLTRVAV